MALSPSITCPQCGSRTTGLDTCTTCGTPRPNADEINPRPQAPFTSSPALEEKAPAVPTVPPPLPIDHAHNHSRLHPIFWGTGQTLFGIFITNTFFTILTLGIYAFWGRVRIRQFLHSQTSFAKIRFAYHGTGKELMMGWSKAFIVFGLPYLSLSLIPSIWPQFPDWIPNLLAGTLILFFIPVAVVGAHRYRLSRTSLGTIRFSFRGRFWDYYKIWTAGSLLTFVTLGLYYPVFENTRRCFLVCHTFFGTHPFRYHGTGKGMWLIYAKAMGMVLLIVIGLVILSAKPEAFPHVLQWTPDEWQETFMTTTFTVGMTSFLVPWCYLQVAKQRYMWNHSGIGQSGFRFTASIWNLMELRVTNFFMLILTFGLAWPWVQIRNLQFLYYHLSLPGPVNFQDIQQEALDASPTGEGLAGYFDAGFDIG
ncbi:MAG: YjgN family protein [Nitrospirales bacterium]